MHHLPIHEYYNVVKLPTLKAQTTDRSLVRQLEPRKKIILLLHVGSDKIADKRFIILCLCHG